ncbi:TolC family protein [Acidiphilium sp.]|uniref:TolC family protein n=1 Tax=Acidiphilium sp. TaxID=527 RepID=UPI00258AD5C3|nr:TolC family protein [Acidiphilium sp.]
MIRSPLLRLRRLAGLGALLGLSACARFHPAPLALRPSPAASLAALDRALPGGGTIAARGALTPGAYAALAVLNDPALAAGREEVRLASARQFAAGLLPDPQVSGGFAALLGGPGIAPSISGGIAQDIAALVTRGPRLSAARARTAAAAARFEWQEWQVAAKAETLAIGLWGEQRRLAALERARDALAGLDRASRAAIKQGDLALGAGAAAAASLAGIETARDAIARREQADHAALAALLGLAPGAALPVSEPDSAPLPARLVAALVGSLARRRPDLIALRYGYRAADADLRAAIRAQFPLVSLAVNGGTDTTRVASLGPTITLDLPLFDGHRGAIAVARASRRQLAAAFRAALDQAAGQAEAAQQALTLLDAEYRRAVRGAAIARRDAAAARRAYAAGLIDARAEADLIDAAANRRAEAIDLRARIAAGRVSLRTLLGAGLPVIRSLSASGKD